MTNTEDLTDPLSSKIPMEMERKQRPLCSLPMSFLVRLGHWSRPWPPTLGKTPPPTGPKVQKQPAASHQTLTRVVTSTVPAGGGGPVWPQFHCLPVWTVAGTIHLGEGSHSPLPLSPPQLPHQASSHHFSPLRCHLPIHPAPS